MSICQILGLNSHFQNILTTINRITASIKTLLPAALPATVQAATITHGVCNSNYDCHGSDICYFLVHCKNLELC